MAPAREVRRDLLGAPAQLAPRPSEIGQSSHPSGARRGVVREHPDAVLGWADGQVAEVAGVAAERGPEDVAQDASASAALSVTCSHTVAIMSGNPPGSRPDGAQVPVERGAGPPRSATGVAL